MSDRALYQRLKLSHQAFDVIFTEYIRIVMEFSDKPVFFLETRDFNLKLLNTNILFVEREGYIDSRYFLNNLGWGVVWRRRPPSNSPLFLTFLRRYDSRICYVALLK